MVITMTVGIHANNAAFNVWHVISKGVLNAQALVSKEWTNLTAIIIVRVLLGPLNKRMISNVLAYVVQDYIYIKAME